MSPGSSSQSCSGSKWRRIFSGTPSTQAAVARAADAPAAPALHLQQEHVVGIEVRADAAAVAGVGEHQVVEPRIGHEAKARQQRVRGLARAGRAPCTSSVQPGCVSGGSARRGSGPWRSVQPPAVAHHQARLDVVARGQREQRGARQRRGHARQRLAHQQRLLLPVPAHELRGDRPPSSGSGGSGPCRIVPSGVRAGGGCAIIAAMKIAAPCVVSLTWTLADAQGQPDRRTGRAGRVLLWRRRPAAQGRRGAGRPGGRLRGAPAPRARACLRRLRQPSWCASRTRALFPEELEAGMQFEGLPDGQRHAGHAGRRDLHRDRDLPVARGARRQPPAGRHGAAPAR